jgi:hypothetical protein
MHAIVIHANIHDPAEAKRGLDETVLPMIKNAPGFVAAYFVALDDGQGVSIEVFETEEQAKAAAPPKDVAAPGVTLDTIHFGEVIGAA